MQETEASDIYNQFPWLLIRKRAIMTELLPLLAKLELTFAGRKFCVVIETDHCDR
jgi:hypothetical protein